MVFHGDLAVDDPWEAIEACYEAGWSDGLPVVPPSEALVEAMLAGGIWERDHELLREPSRGLAVSAHKAAANAVMAGCRPEYFPVVGAALQAMGHPEFGLHGPATSTGGAAMLVAVNGPIRDDIGINCKESLFGPGHRANATIGRAVRLVLQNCLAVVPGALDKSTQGWAGKYTLCFGEDEASCPWEPFHVSRGYDAWQSTVTVMAAESGHNVPEPCVDGRRRAARHLRRRHGGPRLAQLGPVADRVRARARPQDRRVADGAGPGSRSISSSTAGARSPT